MLNSTVDHIVAVDGLAIEKTRGESQVGGIENGTVLSGPSSSECHPSPSCPPPRIMARRHHHHRSQRHPRGPTHKPPVAGRAIVRLDSAAGYILGLKFWTVAAATAADSRARLCHAIRQRRASRVHAAARSIGTGNGIYTISPLHNLRLRRHMHTRQRPSQPGWGGWEVKHTAAAVALFYNIRVYITIHHRRLYHPL